MDWSWRRGIQDFSWAAYPAYGHESAIRNTSWRGHGNHPAQSAAFYSTGYPARYDLRQDYHPYASAAHNQPQPSSSGFVPLLHNHRYLAPTIPGFGTEPSSYLPPRANPTSRPIKEDFTNFSSEPEPLSLHFEVASTRIDVSWKPPKGHKNTYYYLIEVLNNTTAKRARFEKKWTQTTCELKVVPGIEYSIKVDCRRIMDDRVIATVNGIVTARFSHDEYMQLYKNCEVFARNDMHPFEYLYRCKPKCYWDDIHLFRSGIMQKYAKDYNGQPANWINGVLSGLFFSARLDRDGYLPTASPFGDTRMLIHASTLLNPISHNFYFSDFYCNYYTHYITIVICRKDSDTDLYSKKHLIRINPEDNMFLKVCRPVYPSSMPTYFVNKNIWVEIYYTEDIPLSWGRFDSIHATGAGTSKIGGLPNNKDCDKCNLYPIKDPNYESNKENSNSTSKPDDYYYDVQDASRPEDLLNSTFKVLINQDKSTIEDWEDIIEVICNAVDSVCNSEAEEQKDPMAKSDESVLDALQRMREGLASVNGNKNAIVQKVAKEFEDFVDDFRQTRDAMLKKITAIWLPSE